MTIRFLPCVAPLLLLGCPEGSDKINDTAETGETAPDDTGDPATVPLAGECTTDVDFGGFTVVVDAAETEVAGTVADGVVPASVLEELVAEGDCRVLRRNNPYCEPACDPGTTCDFDGTCVPYPVNQDLGTVTISGLSAAVSMTPQFPGNTYYDTELPHPGFVGGELLTLDMPGGVYGPLVLHGVGVEPLVGATPTWVVEAGVDFVLTWTPPAAEVARGEVTIQLSIDQHGVSPSRLVCTFADDGEGVVPGSILQALVDVGVTGFPSGAMARRTADAAAAGAGCLDFLVSSPIVPEVDVVGHTPCVSDKDCPKGQTCNEELQICE